MEPTEEQGPARRVTLVQWLRWLNRVTIWYGLTTLLDRLGFTPTTVQVLCIDIAADELLLLQTREFSCGYSPVQGLRRGSLTFGLVAPRIDVRADARRELLEEAVLDAPPLADFWVAERYREGPYAQFDCTVLVVPCRKQDLALRGETSEGKPVWLPVSKAVATLDNPALRDLIADWREDSGTGPAVRERRFLLGPSDELRPRPTATEPEAIERLWSMALRMLAAARALGRRDATQVYQANPTFAGELWRGMSTAARDCYRPDPRLWRDCRLLHAERIAELLRGWWDARVEALSERGRNGDARSIPGKATPAAAVAAWERTDCAFSLDLIYDSEEDRVGCFLTRGGEGGVTSDVLLYAMMSSRYLPIPVFHTHPRFRSTLGYKQPSPPEFWLMSALYYRLNGAPVGDAAFFSDGTWTEYGITGHGRCFYRRAADALLPAAGEPATRFVDLTLPERPRPS
jgi:hypothetical protein